MGSGLCRHGEMEEGTKGSASGKPVLASNTVGWGEVIGRWAEVMGEIMSEAMKVKDKM